MSRMRMILCFRTLGRRPGGRSRRRGGRGQSGGGGPAGAQDVAASMLPSEGLPLVSGRVSSHGCSHESHQSLSQGTVEDEEIMVWFSAGTCVSFVINKNLTTVTKQLQYPPLNNKLCWNFATRGGILSEPYQMIMISYQALPALARTRWSFSLRSRREKPFLQERSSLCSKY